jgi:hypothetical protein
MMKLLSKLGVLSVLACGAVPIGCSSDTTSLPAKADAATAKDAGGIFCGTKYCKPRQDIGIETETLCCTDSGDCGLKFPTANKCLPPDQPGIPSADCGDYAIPNQSRTLTGCCGPKGCGKEDAFLGCIVNTDLDLPAQTCAYDPTNTCGAVSDIPCDGPEDCPGQHCCTEISTSSGGTSKTKCYDSCVALAGDGGGSTTFWRELCHAGDTCEDPTFQCRTSQFLPPFLNRCVSGMGNPAPTNLDTSKSRVNCGSGVCGAGQKCCFSTSAMGTLTAYCAEKNAACKCNPPDGGASKPGPLSPAPTDAGSKD